MAKETRIEEGGLEDPRVVELLAIHVSKARAETAPGSAHALDLNALRVPEIRFWTAWDGDSILGAAGLKRLSPTHGEIKSMHTNEKARRRGIGSALLQHVIEEARADGMTQLSLETGSWAYFHPARAFYARHGFTECGPFGDYVRDPNSVFMTLQLDAPEAT
jgi:putative acetyltransferase